MHELSDHDQGAGLRRLAPAPRPVQIGVVQHGDRAADMDMLWRLCNGFQSLGYSVAVLDATMAETTARPGLLDMLNQACRPQRASGAAWPVIPAALGLRSLQHGQGAFETLALSQLFRDFGAVLIYADADAMTLSPLLGNTRSVLALSPQMPSLLSAYQCIKRLVHEGGADQITVVTALAADSSPELAVKIARSLQKCTMKHVKCELRHFVTRPSPDHDDATDDSRRLVLHLVDRQGAAGTASDRAVSLIPGNFAHPLWSH